MLRMSQTNMHVGLAAISKATYQKIATINHNPPISMTPMRMLMHAGTGICCDFVVERRAMELMAACPIMQSKGSIVYVQPFLRLEYTSGHIGG